MHPEIPFVPAGCRFPRNFTGYYEGDYEPDSFVTINSTHIYVITIINQYEFMESYFVCLQNVDSRYLTYSYDVGKWASSQRCDLAQTAFSQSIEEGSTMKMTLKENERLCWW
ncbi:hypothetical protein HELRODRAFT_179768 [Helobdella robusta]|uniref:Uncharacterized protein n=1 Tax=Helobdella robusta TaxID=6412 RepID=T1FF47_HELRO|nr:hypothetical protein HELRODRAFT_179768 [Helobdella robusta]ESN95170.1 hypothetical protein HELRODRAFT_179768 [Helobdella robusta]